ncbi:hypothetical protein [Nocardioides kribbensis]|uniref:Ankyrin repeat domain-containing protein n=1 Tax=Nocardioides kribbensis TaxID=305517 RepID=A0ABV1NTF1_9ACTN
MIGPDWSVDTGHDIETERIAVALGGTLTCVEIVDRTIPAVQHAVRLLARESPPPIQRDGDTWWSLDRADCRGCERERRSLPKLAEHMRTPAHTAEAWGHPHEFHTILSAVTQRHPGISRRPEYTATGASPAGGRQLWDLGIGPREVRRLKQDYLPHRRTLPAAFFAALTFVRPDEEFVRSVIAATDDVRTIAWAVWNYHGVDVLYPHNLAELLRTGATTGDVKALHEGFYLHSEVDSLARKLGLPPGDLVAIVADWCRAGYAPAIGDLAALWEVTADPGRIVPEQEVDSLLASLGPGHRPDRTSTAMILAIAGTEDIARDLIARGARDAQTAHSLLRQTPPRDPGSVSMWGPDEPLEGIT